MLNKKLLGSVSSPPAEFVDDVFSTHLYAGTGAAQTINNGIDLAGKGGLTWIKARTSPSFPTNNILFDTARGATKLIRSDLTNAESTFSSTLSAFNSNGFSLGDDSGAGFVNYTGHTYCSWTFRKAPKFFDVVTYTGTGVATNIAHNLGSTPGMIIIKMLNTASNWIVYHRASPNTDYLYLNEPNSTAEVPDYWNDTTPNSSTFRVNTNSAINGSGQPYVAYLFAHNAGGFGAAGTDNVISCGSYTGNGAVGNTVNLGFEPQFVMIKCSSTGGNDWLMYDVMRGMPTSATNTGDTKFLRANTSAAEAGGATVFPTATGFQLNTTFAGANTSGDTYIYMAIRRPMKPPTSGTQVFSPIAATTGVQTTGFTIDSQLLSFRGGNAITTSQFVDRLRGVSTTTTELGQYLITSSTAAESNTYANSSNSWNNTGFKVPQNYDGTSSVFYSFRRATGFFDIVCYTGTGVNRTVAHNLGVVPELIIHKRRTGGTDNWQVLSSINSSNYNRSILNSTSAGSVESYDPSTFFSLILSPPTSSSYVVSQYYASSGSTYVNYLFASVAGVSKVFSFTGNGSSQTINCGFTAGARLVLIKRTDSTGDWYIWDSSRGIVSGNDPRLSLNTTAAEVTSDDSIDPDNSGFIVNQLAATNINVSSATYIGIAIA